MSISDRLEIARKEMAKLVHDAKEIEKKMATLNEQRQEHMQAILRQDGKLAVLTELAEEE